MTSENRKGFAFFAVILAVIAIVYVVSVYFECLKKRNCSFLKNEPLALPFNVQFGVYIGTKSGQTPPNPPTNSPTQTEVQNMQFYYPNIVYYFPQSITTTFATVQVRPIMEKYNVFVTWKPDPVGTLLITLAVNTATARAKLICYSTNTSDFGLIIPGITASVGVFHISSLQNQIVSSKGVVSAETGADLVALRESQVTVPGKFAMLGRRSVEGGGIQTIGDYSYIASREFGINPTNCSENTIGIYYVFTTMTGAGNGNLPTPPPGDGT
jgi:hypothetical protein